MIGLTRLSCQPFLRLVVCRGYIGRIGSFGLHYTLGLPETRTAYFGIHHHHQFDKCQNNPHPQSTAQNLYSTLSGSELSINTSHKKGESDVAVNTHRITNVGHGASSIEALVEQMSSDLRKKGRINRQDLEAIVTLLDEGAAIGGHSTKLLQSCCKQFLPELSSEKLIKLLQQLCSSIDGNGRKPEHAEILLRCYTDLDFKDFNPSEILTEIRSLTSSGTLDKKFLNRMYYLILLSFCQRGDLANTVKVLQLVKAEGFLVDETYFNALLIGNSRAGDLSGAKGILGIMHSSQVNPSIKTFTNLMQACIEHNDLDGLSSAYNMCQQEVNLTELEVIELASKSILLRKISALEKVLAWLPVVSATDDPVKAFNSIVTLIHSGFCSEAMKIMCNWQRGVHLTCQGFGVSFIKELVYANVDKVVLVSLCDELSSKGYNQFAINSAAEFCLRKKDFESALMLFKVMKERDLPLRPHYFWPMILNSFANEGLLGITKTLECMVSFDVVPDWDTYMDHILPRLFSVEPDPVQSIKILKEASGISYSSGIFAVCLHYLLKQKRLSDASRLARKVKGNIFHPNAILDLLFRSLLSVESRENITTNLAEAMPILQSVYSGKNFEDTSDYVGKFILRFLDSIGAGMMGVANSLIQNLEKREIPISQSAGQSIQLKIGRDCNFVIDEKLVLIEHNNSKAYNHPKDMDAQSLECHLQELNSKGLNPRGVLRRLFFKYCQEGELSKVLEIKAQFEKSGVTTQGMKSALMGVYIRNGNAKMAYDLYKELTSVGSNLDVAEGWNLDLYKLLDLVTLMANTGLKEEAASLLFTDACKYPSPGGGQILNRNVVKLLEAFAFGSSGTDEDVQMPALQRIVQFVLDNQIVSASTSILSVVIKYLLQKKEVVKAMDLFEEYATTYKLTPGNQLMAYAVLNDKDLLARYTKACSGVHGKANTLHQIAYALSDTGHIREASLILRELGAKLDLNRIKKHCEFLGERKEVEKILNLAQSLSGARKNVDTSEVYNTALKSCKTQQDVVNLRLILDRIESDLPICPPSVLQCVEKIKVQLLVNR